MEDILLGLKLRYLRCERGECLLEGCGGGVIALSCCQYGHVLVGRKTGPPRPERHHGKLVSASVAVAVAC